MSKIIIGRGPCIGDGFSRIILSCNHTILKITIFLFPSIRSWTRSCCSHSENNRRAVQNSHLQTSSLRERPWNSLRADRHQLLQLQRKFYSRRCGDLGRECEHQHLWSVRAEGGKGRTLDTWQRAHVCGLCRLPRVSSWSAQRSTENADKMVGRNNLQNNPVSFG